MQGWFVEALRFVNGPSRTVVALPDGGIGLDLDADPRNADWLRTVTAHRLMRHHAPLWATLWLWWINHDAPDAFWQRVGVVAEELGYERYEPEGDQHLVVGVDGAPGGWLAVVLVAGAFNEACFFSTFSGLLDRYSRAVALGVDIPIGIPQTGTRAADELARRVLGPARAASVFLTPLRAVLEAPTYEQALTISRKLSAQGVSRQAYGLRTKILEVDAAVHEHPRIFEVHPEVSFVAMNWGPLVAPKKTWNGLMERRRLLAQAGIRLDDRLTDAGPATPDDVVDAAAAAWTAHRVAQGLAGSLPNDPPRDNAGRSVAIW